MKDEMKHHHALYEKGNPFRFIRKRRNE